MGSKEGLSVGVEEGASDGDVVGSEEGLYVGSKNGAAVGYMDGTSVEEDSYCNVSGIHGEPHRSNEIPITMVVPSLSQASI